MVYTRLPGDQDFLDMLAAAKLFDGRRSGPLFNELLGYVDGAIDEFQGRTGRKPFLVDLAPVVRTFDPPGGRASRFDTHARPFVRTGICSSGLPAQSAIFTHEKFGGETFLLFDNGLVSLSSVAIEISPENPSGRTLALGHDFNLFPLNAAARGEAWTAIEFRRPIWGLKASVSVLGCWGYSATCPAKAWKGILALAAYAAAPVIEQAITKAQISYQDKDQKVQYNNDPVTGTAAKWKAIGDEACEFFKTPQRKFGR